MKGLQVCTHGGRHVKTRVRRAGHLQGSRTPQKNKKNTSRTLEFYPPELRENKCLSFWATSFVGLGLLLIRRQKDEDEFITWFLSLLTLQMHSSLPLFHNQGRPLHLSSGYLVGAEYPALTDFYNLLFSLLSFHSDISKGGQLISHVPWCSASHIHFFTTSHTTWDELMPAGASLRGPWVCGISVGQRI